MSLFGTTMLDMLFRVSTLKKSTVKMLGLRSWIFSGKILRIHCFFELSGAGVPGGGCMSQFCHTYWQKKGISEESQRNED